MNSLWRLLATFPCNQVCSNQHIKLPGVACFMLGYMTLFATVVFFVVVVVVLTFNNVHETLTCDQALITDL